MLELSFKFQAKCFKCSEWHSRFESLALLKIRAFLNSKRVALHMKSKVWRCTCFTISLNKEGQRIWCRENSWQQEGEIESPLALMHKTKKREGEDQAMSVSAQAHPLSGPKPQMREVGRNHRTWKLFLCPGNSSATCKSQIQPAPGQHQRKTARPADLRTASQCPAYLQWSMEEAAESSQISKIWGYQKIAKIKSGPPPAVPLLSISKITESRDLHRYFYTPVHSSIIHNS